jgi:uncharacterized membrane protein
MIVAFVLFVVSGFVFGYALGNWGWTALVIPLLFAIPALVRDGIESDIVIKMIVVLVLTSLGVIAGQLVDRREAREGPAT